MLVVVALLALGLLLLIISGRAIVRLMYRLDHPDEPMPRWRYRRGLIDFVEDMRIYYRYCRRHGFDPNVLANLGGFACIVAGVVLAENIDAVLDLLGWTCGSGTIWC